MPNDQTLDLQPFEADTDTLDLQPFEEQTSTPFVPATPRQPLAPEQLTTYGGPPKPVASAAETLLEPTEEMMNPRVTIPRIQIKETDPLYLTAGKEAVNVLSGLPEFMSSNAGIMGLVGGAAAPIATTAGFTADMLGSLGKQVYQSYKNWDKMTPTQKTTALTDMAGTGAFTALLGTHLGKGIADEVVPARALAKQINQAELTPTPEMGLGRLPEKLNIAPPEQEAPKFEETTAPPAERMIAPFEGLDLQPAEQQQSPTTVADQAGASTDAIPAEQVAEIPAGPGAKTATAAESFEGTGLKNAIGELEAQGVGHDLTPSEQHAMAPLWVQAGDVLKVDPEAGRRLADDLIKTPERGMTDEDSALLLRHKRDLVNQLNDAAERTHTGDAESRAIADREYIEKSDQLKALLDAVKKRGSHWGREGRWRQAMAYEDYSFATQEGLLRAAKGGEHLTDAERTKLLTDIELHKQNAIAQEAHRIKAESEASDLRAKAALDAIELEKRPRIDPYIIRIAEQIGNKVHSAANAARERLKSREGLIFGSGPVHELANIKDFAIIGADHIYSVGLDAAKWGLKMVEEFGDGIKPHLNAIFEASKKEIERISGVNTEAVKKVIRKKSDVAETQADITGKIAEKLKGKKLSEITPLVQQLARSFSDQGVRGWRDMRESVHGVLKQLIPGLDPRETADAISGHGKFKRPNQAEGAKALADTKAQLNLVSKIREVIAKEPVKPTGLQRDPLSDIARQLNKIYENAKKKFGIVTEGDSANHLRTALQTRETYYKNRMSDLLDEIKKNKRLIRDKAAPATSPKLEILIAEYEKVKARHDEVFGPRELTDTQRADLEAKSLDRQIAEVQRQIKEGDIFPTKKAKFTATQNEAKRADLEALKSERDYLRESVQPSRPLSDAQRLSFIKAGMERRQANLLDRMAKGQFEPVKAKAPPPLDPEGARLMTQGRDIEKRFERARKDAELAARSPAKKFVDRFIVGTYNSLRSIAVMGHGTVGMFTHAGGLLYRATTAKIWWRNFLRQFPMWLKPAYHEQLIHRLKTDPEFHTWLKAGAKIDPDMIYEDYAKYGETLGKLAAGGQRGFDALKLARMELNKAQWEKVSDDIKSDPEQAMAARKAIAEMNNKATGTAPLFGQVAEANISGLAHGLFFAPKLYASRWSRVLFDPVTTANTFAKWDKATPVEKTIAKAKLKNAAEFAAIYLGTLAVNQGILSAKGSDQKINFTDPTKTDWLKFKGHGKTVIADGGLLDPIRLLGQVVYGDLMAPRTPQERFLKGNRFEAAVKDLGKYVRSKFNPSLGLVVDSATGQDFSGRALPFSNEPSKYKSQKKYTWGEWLLSHGPIPLSSGSRVAYDELQKRGLSKADAAALLEGAAAASIGLTGMHETEDYTLKNKSSSKF